VQRCVLKFSFIGQDHAKGDMCVVVKWLDSDDPLEVTQGFWQTPQQSLTFSCHKHAGDVPVN